MDVKSIRKDNLQRLLDEAGGREALARKVGTSPAYISQIRSERTAADVGHQLARRLESAMGKPEGWMDVAHGVSEEADLVREAVFLVSPRARAAVAALLAEIVRDPTIAGRLARIADGVQLPDRGGTLDVIESAPRR